MIKIMMKMKNILGKKGYNKFLDGFKPKEEGKCDACGSELETRVDDNEESFTKEIDNMIKRNYNII